MGQHEDKIAILRKYYKDIPAGAFDLYKVKENRQCYNQFRTRSG